MNPGPGITPSASDLIVDPTIRVDHVSIAVPCMEDGLAFFQRHFPIEMGFAKMPGYSGDFNWCDFYIGRFKLELIEPGAKRSFVDRFLARRGPGMHHLSLETTQLSPWLDRMEADGVRIVDRFGAPGGAQTAFISPRSAHGTLIQLWGVPEFADHTPRPSIVPFRLRNGDTVRMRVDHISMAVRDIEQTLRFFGGYFPFRLRRPPHPGWDGTFSLASFWLNDYKVELIQELPGRSGFVERFIRRRGEGFHHISIDVDRLDPYLAQLEADGLRIVDKYTLPDGQKTAFISPRSACGTLIQFWQPRELRDP